MGRHITRLRALEHKLVPSGCPVCAGYPAIDFVTVHGAETPPPAPPPCEACGKLATRFIVHHAAELGDAGVETTPPPTHDNNARAESHSKARTRRRRFYGTE